MYSIITLSLSGLLMLFVGLLKNKKILTPLSILSFVVAGAAALYEWNVPGIWFNKMVEINNLGIGFTLVLCLTGILIVSLSDSFEKISPENVAELHAIIQFATVGGIMMATYQNLIMLFLGIEIISVAMYVLTGSDKQNIRGNEAALKYFLMGAFTTGIILFGVAMIYGALGSFDIHHIDSVAAAAGEKPIHLYIGLVMVLIGLLFKVSAVPFHFWTPDVYDGAPTIFTAFMSTAVKTASFAAMAKLLLVSFGSVYGFWSISILIPLLLTLILANFAAASQKSFKRLLAYSSISHAGFMLLSIYGINEQTENSIIFYSLAYTLATIVAFGVLMLVSQGELKDGRPNEDLSVLSGLSSENPLLGTLLSISMLSMAGIPLTGGFWAKFFVFKDFLHRGQLWVLVVAVLMAVVGIYYYFKPILLAWNGTEGKKIHVGGFYKWVLIVATLGTIVLGIAPGLFVDAF